MLLLLQLGARFEGEVWFERKTGAGDWLQPGGQPAMVQSVRFGSLCSFDSTRLDSNRLLKSGESEGEDGQGPQMARLRTIGGQNHLRVLSRE